MYDDCTNEDIMKKLYEMEDAFLVISEMLGKISLENTLLRKKIDILSEQTNTVQQYQDVSLRQIQENNWADVFNNTISNSDWLKDTSLSLGRAAIGYQCAYVLYRILDEVKPLNILEIGLGQSTKIINQYAKHNSNVSHYVVESDLSWIDFFKNNYELNSSTEIIHCDYQFEDYENIKNIRTFKDFEKKLPNKNFDLILIDAPLSLDMTELARIDILKILPKHLNDSYIIMLDDVDRVADCNLRRPAVAVAFHSGRPALANGRLFL